MIALCAVVAGADSWPEVERFGTEGLEAVDADAVRRRVSDLYGFAHFEPIDVALKATVS